MATLRQAISKRYIGRGQSQRLRAVCLTLNGARVSSLFQEEVRQMDRRNFVLAALSVAKGGLHTPVQVQKLFFLIDQEIPELVEGPRFNFVPYNYGPFDQDVYRDLDILRLGGFVDLVPQGTWSSYRLTPEGQSEGDLHFAALEQKAAAYIIEASDFVRKLSFTQLVSAIYKAYPDMRQNSVFQQ